MNTFVAARSAEPLEARIAPAVLFLSGLAFDVFDDTGTSVKLPGVGGAAFGVKLSNGDSLVLDTNGNHVRDAGEIVYAKVLGGVSEFFARNVAGGAGVDAGDMTGIAVGDGFNARINGNLNGSVVTLFDATGSLDTTRLADASIAGLVVTGGVAGSIYAGRDVNGVDIRGFAGANDFSVDSILTGTEASGQDITLGATFTTIHPIFTFGKNLSGGNITGIKLAFGAKAIQAGDGMSSATAAGNGGNIGAVTMLRAPEVVLLSAGDGGDITAATKGGGNGGVLNGFSVTLDTTTGELRAEAGHGGDGVKGGNGGVVSGGKVRVLVDSEAAVIIGAGDGGQANQGTPPGAPGNGGSVLTTSVKAFGALGYVSVTGGRGGDASAKAKGGKGGDAIGTTIEVGAVELGIEIRGGDGGGSEDGKAGDGGTINSLSAKAGVIDDGAFIVTGGTGGTALSLGGGGAGGGVLGATLTLDDIAQQLTVTGGIGGDGTTAGSGGALIGLLATFRGVGDAASFAAGGGGLGFALGGPGGAVKGVTLTALGFSANGVLVASGDGGEGISFSDATGGNGGPLSAVTIEKAAGQPDAFSVFSGTGGSGGGAGNGGAGGSAKGVTFTATSAALSLDVGNFGGGGDAGDTGQAGGPGGTLSGVKIIAPSAPIVLGSFIYAGTGGDASGPGAQGGPAGAVKGVFIDGINAVVRINGGNAFSDFSGGDGGTGANSSGGAGGGVSGITGRVGQLIVSAMNGGSAEGTGGDGGGIKGVNLSEVGQFIRLLRAGDGGGGMIAGKGGSVSGVTTPGDIGDFTAAFNLDADAVGMGGIVAGLGGRVAGLIDTAKNGSVSGVTAERIAAIVAGAAKANALTTDNAVTKITGLNVLAVGADVNGTGFSFTDNPNPPNPSNGVFLLGDGDTALDGLVIVKSGGGGAALPIAPSQLFEV
ncbi:MAG: hypothetical protein QOE70_2651 [Chthoniobacter sp.]|jgi:hypothetical protein|nr:hypothetical protein [Chthoniobacter sp.]